jgi:hypothetical protein
VVLYDRSSESYLVDLYESGPWTSQHHGPAGKTLLTPMSWSGSAAATWLIRSSRVTRWGCRSALGWPAGPVRPPWPTPANVSRVQRAILPGKLARPSLRARVLGRTLADFQARLPAKITLVNDDGVLADT